MSLESFRRARNEAVGGHGRARRPSKQQLSGDDFEEEFLLFVHPRDKNSQRSVRLLQQGSFADQVKINNICHIPAKFLPEFVDGVPILADMRERTLYKGSNCLSEIKRRSENEFASAERCTSGYGAFGDGTALLHGAGATNAGDCSTTLFMGGDAEDARDEQAERAAQTVEDYQALRNKSFERRHKQQSKSTARR